MYFHKTIFQTRNCWIKGNAYLKFWTNSKRQSSECHDFISEWKKKSPEYTCTKKYGTLIFNQQLCPPEGIWKCLESILVVTTGKVPVSSGKAGWCKTTALPQSRIIWPRRSTALRVKNPGAWIISHTLQNSFLWRVENNNLFICTVCGFCFVLQRTCTSLKNTFMNESSPSYWYKNPSLHLLILVLYLRDKFWKTQTRLTEFSLQPTDSRKFFWMLFLGISFKSLHLSDCNTYYDQSAKYWFPSSSFALWSNRTPNLKSELIILPHSAYNGSYSAY